jgi:hypothetical protein
MPGPEDRGEVLQQINTLRRRMNRLEQEWKVSSERDGPRAESVGEEPRRQRTPPEQTQRLLSPQVERDRPPRQGALAADVDELRACVGVLQEQLTQTQAAVNAMLSQSGRSTVGSAGYTWGW